MYRRSGYREQRSPENFRGILREVWLSPGRFFKRLDPDVGFVRPTIFASAVFYLNLILGALLQAALLGEFTYSLLYAPLLGLVVSIVLAPLLIAGTAALVLTILDGAPSREKFGPVFRSLGYATAIGLVLWIPYAPLLALPYGAYVATVAVKETLKESWPKAAAATLIPLGAILLIVFFSLGASGAYDLLLNPARG